MLCSHAALALALAILNWQVIDCDGLIVSFVKYPGYMGSLSVTGGSVLFSPRGSDAFLTHRGPDVFLSQRSDASQIMSYEIIGGDASCGTANVTGIANACGVHIHVGTNCSDASTIGGHFWNKTLYSTDPWQSVMYKTVKGKAYATDVRIATGLTNQEVADRVVIIHDAAGARISCIPVSIGSPGGLVSSYVVSYPGYTGKLSVMGSLRFSPQGSDASQILSYKITGGDSSCGTANVTGIANACGVHVHVGTNCSDASTIGGHFWNKTLYSADPWQSVMYATVNGKASATDVTIATGLTNQEVADRVVIIHDATGARISCSQMYFFKKPPAQTSTASSSSRLYR
ncbi:unnamed protein product [Polarella glacialis]|uniref:Superoxide dismutase copper/zinc binding domain-containing protein n=1 Tax=Polarella glacialis TaxID=89957 RepID=A0A813LI80_POLGL|nr:unnamed protein product [Polarella glacialis]